MSEFCATIAFALGNADAGGTDICVSILVVLVFGRVLVVLEFDVACVGLRECVAVVGNWGDVELGKALSPSMIGAYDHVSRAAMLQGLYTRRESRVTFCPLILQPAVNIFVDRRQRGGTSHHASRWDDGGEQEDPLMPALFSLGLDYALRAFHNELLSGERAAAFLDDIYVTASPSRIRPLFE